MSMGSENVCHGQPGANKSIQFFGSKLVHFLDFERKMGCLWSKFDCFSSSQDDQVVNESNNIQKTDEGEKIYSWDLRRNEDNNIDQPKLNNYLIENLQNTILIKDNNRGGQLVIKNCVNFKTYVLTDLSSVTIDDCFGCLIVLGPVKGSVYMRDCKDITLVCASSQLRFRDCDNVRMFTATESDPVIENSQKVFTAPYYLNYNGIQDDFDAAKLSRFACSSNWYKIYDYTPPVEGQNWSRFTGEFAQFLEYPDPDQGINIKANLLKDPFVPMINPDLKPEGDKKFSDSKDLFNFLSENNKQLIFCDEKQDSNGLTTITIQYG